LEDIEKLSKITSLDSLDLSALDNLWGTEISLLNIIREQSNSLIHINLSDTSITSDVIKLIKALSNCTKLNYLNLSHQQVLKGQVTKTDLHDEQQHLHVKGISKLIPILGQCTRLTELDVSDNKLTGNDSIFLDQCLPKWTLLINLNLDRCFLNQFDIYFLTLTLPSCNSLTKLSLEDNRIGDLNSSYLVEILPKCISLYELKLNSYNLTDTGAEMFEKFFDKGVKIRMNLFLCGNQITPQTRQKICNKYPNVKI
jgi:Ran GTPase-activating protein (RanGAP) involved in mRNA processing and transport